MGKKMKLPFLSKINSDSSTSSSPWPWPAYCHQPKTLSFRISENMFKTLHSAFLDVADTPAESWFTNSSEFASVSTASDEPSLETMIKGLRSERLFFEPGETSSILEEAKEGSGDDEFPFKESVILSMDSQDPYVDFKKSMEEMVEAHGIKDWEGVEELLCCYLKVNEKINHGYIMGAFVDLVFSLGLASSTTSDSCSCSRSPSSPLSFYASSFSDDSSSTPCVSSLEAADQEEIHVSPCSSSLEAHKEITMNKIN